VDPADLISFLLELSFHVTGKVLDIRCLHVALTNFGSF